jgi:hypothetical protein
MHILESIDHIMESDAFDREFRELRSALGERPIDLMKMRTALMKLYRIDADEYYEKAWMYTEGILNRLRGVSTREDGGSYFPVISNLENETAFEGAAYVADARSKSFSASSLKGLIDRLKEEYPGGITRSRIRDEPGVGKVMVYTKKGYPEVFDIRNSASRLRLDREEMKYLKSYVKELEGGT